ncbi:hypothetical protein ASG31_09680 [Chryseobacterium sp. Leaf404]|uniref:hypothetical protein n=1 Tax=unclassified Chryseobacterium TaxID=2593645 RepID=UPI0006F258AA|nr:MULTISPECIES: hypothetical protein [unclassified Chryseobacterium]KQT17652.1 hypothetical protein ASG31_09680 [Chryseobacterium sp. Leaf404]
MKFYIKYLLCFSGILGSAQSKPQIKSYPPKQINFVNSEYKDFVVVKDVIYALSQNNDLIVIDLKKDNFWLIKNNITAIAKKSNDELVVGNMYGEVFILKKRKRLRMIDKIDAKIFSIFITSKNEPVIYSDKSIYYNKREYIPKRQTNFYGKVRDKYTGTKLIEPDYLYLDREDFMWFDFDEGEWGGNVCFFDLNTKQFIYDDWLLLDDGIKYKKRNDYFAKLREKFPEIIKVTKRDTLYRFPYNLNISSGMTGVAYDDKNDLFITSSGGGMIYSTNNNFSYFVDGTVVKISKKEKDFFKSCFDEKILEDEKYKIAFGKYNMGFKNLNREVRENILTENEINRLGAITFNKYDRKLYIYSTKGFYSLHNHDCTFTKKKFFSPELLCKIQNERDYCIHLNVTKFEFISEKEILFLTKNNGIGYYDGKTVKYYR